PNPALTLPQPCLTPNPNPAQPCPALPCPNPALPCPAGCPALPTLPCPALPCPALPCYPALPCPENGITHDICKVCLLLVQAASSAQQQSETLHETQDPLL
ncbi:hypothetical protein MIR68_003519, partial [Amoeboaphelidium protococcarum]